MAIAGLDNYGFKEEARRIARKYVDSIVGIYRSTGNLWEKFNAEHGNLEVNNEYEMPPFMGWTAGAFIFASDYLDRTAPADTVCATCVRMQDPESQKVIIK